MTIEGALPRAGAALTMRHRYAGFRVERVGRILRWRENEGYSFQRPVPPQAPATDSPTCSPIASNLSPRETSRLHIRVTGKMDGQMDADMDCEVMALVGLQPRRAAGGD